MNLEKELSFYSDGGEGKKVNPHLYDEVAKEVASGLVKVRDKFTNGVSRHQLRNLFDETKRIQRRLDNRTQKWEDVEPVVRLLKSKTSYAVARAKNNNKFDADYYDFLKRFIHTGVDKIHDEKDFEVFCTLFEAVYGFYYEMGGANTK